MIAAASVGVFAWSKLSSLSKRSSDEAQRNHQASCEVGGNCRAGSSRSWSTVSSAVSMGLEVGLRNSRSPGARLLGIRRVSASTGGPISIGSVIVHQLVARLLTAPMIEIMRPLQRRQMDRMKELAPRLKELEREQPDDPAARQRAMVQFYKENKVHPLRSCLGVPVAALAVHLPIFRSRLHQTLPDRLAGIIVVKA